MSWLFPPRGARTRLTVDGSKAMKPPRVPFDELRIDLRSGSAELWYREKHVATLGLNVSEADVLTLRDIKGHFNVTTETN